jgi:uncharacterized protein (UPF0261 family)
MMKALPFGVPKFMVSSSASMPYGPQYIDTKDITLMHSVVDMAGVNELSHAILVRAAGGVCGMAKASDGPLKTTVHERPLVAVTEFKFAERCVKWVLDGMSDHGYDAIVWHANGTGDRAMDELIEQGLYDAVIDVVPAGVSEFMFGGNRAAGPHRLEAAGRVGIPQVPNQRTDRLAAVGNMGKHGGAAKHPWGFVMPTVLRIVKCLEPPLPGLLLPLCFRLARPFPLPSAARRQD